MKTLSQIHMHKVFNIATIMPGHLWKHYHDNDMLFM